jgi:hypothetical protein
MEVQENCYESTAGNFLGSPLKKWKSSNIGNNLNKTKFYAGRN